MKQILSVADFGLILNLVNKEINSMEYSAKHQPYWNKEPSKEEIREKMMELKRNQFYRSLIHLKESLENLNVEVETPDIFGGEQRVKKATSLDLTNPNYGKDVVASLFIVSE